MGLVYVGPPTPLTDEGGAVTSRARISRATKRRLSKREALLRAQSQRAERQAQMQALREEEERKKDMQRLFDEEKDRFVSRHIRRRMEMKGITDDLLFQKLRDGIDVKITDSKGNIDARALSQQRQFLETAFRLAGYLKSGDGGETTNNVQVNVNNVKEEQLLLPPELLQQSLLEQMRAAREGRAYVPPVIEGEVVPSSGVPRLLPPLPEDQAGPPEEGEDEETEENPFGDD